MTFIKRHNPQNITDLVFRDATVGSIITDYAQGLRDKHLMLYGLPGSGKSIAAQIILNTQVGDLAGSAVAQPINARDYTFETFEPLLYQWSAQKMNGVARGYTVIDEIDDFSDRMLQKLRAFIDSTDLGTIIVTTNNLHKLDEPFKDRFRKLHVKRPNVTDWIARAQKILAAEGILLTQEEVGIALNGFEGSARELIEWLEDHVLGPKSSPLLLAPSAQSSEPANITSPFATLKSSKTLINSKPRSNTGTSK
jgi:replication-associated recombination protein RarA